ncbi:uridine kinase family protein [Streptomyces mayteni]
MISPAPHESDARAGLDRLAARLSALPPSCGRTRLVAIDGHAGSGKSTLAGRLATALGGAPVVRLDDLASHEAFFDWTDRLTAGVLDPLSRDEPAGYQAYDWERRAFTRAVSFPPAPVVLLEGVGAGRRAVRPHLAFLVWLRVPAETAWARGRERDGPELAGFWRDWVVAERRHFAEDPSEPHADILMRPRGDSYDACE